MQAMFRAIWSDVRDNPEVRVAVITATGERHFCTGFDVAEADGEAAAEDVFVDKPLREAVFWSPYQNDVWKPVICVVNGTCVGGGHHFVVDADIVIASRNAKFIACPVSAPTSWVWWMNWWRHRTRRAHWRRTWPRKC